MQLSTETFDVAARKHAFSGVVTIDVGDERTFERCRGFAHRALAVPNTPDTQFGIASGSKMFTALAVMRLVEDGMLRLDQPVREVLGADLPLIDDAVTIEQLLSHTSGIGDYLDEDSDGEVFDYVLTRPVHELTTAAAFLPMLDGFPQSFPPGQRLAYCNGGYMVLAVVIERITGEVFHDVVRRLVLAPAGLAHTDYLRLDELPATAAVGYVFDTGDRANTLHLPVLGNGDGGAFTTAGDLHRFWRAFLAGAIVSPDTVAEMIRPRGEIPGEDMWCGLGVYSIDPGGTVLAIEGYDAGASFRSTHIVASQTTVSVLGNSSEGAWPLIYTLAEAIEAESGS
ncbi:serine hydrolase domain-containing protein [Microbacterium hominis]|uniref:Beta-lactamase family protein n=1 Tax=Microbacterium hominis TaxID=162426 RepID=A0A7D4UCH1_9MICO|nr:serine hydrolase domain-containing protein [Microbacterium hominis]QKJ20743.1 beta-lactamase family protein [Microbacterium hominis]